MSALVLPLACAVVTWLLLMVLLRSGVAARIALDAPNHRSLHVDATPRVGGLVVLAVALLALTWRIPQLRVLAALAAGLVLVCAWDDRHGLPVVARLCAQLLAAGIACWWLRGAFDWLWLVFTLLVTWAMNLYNFMDGSDGMAGGMAVIGFGALAVAAWFMLPWLALAAACIAASSLGFLLHNFPPARVFMGDAGAVPLGFLAAMLALVGELAKVWPLWFPVLVFSPFVVDASFTLAQRLARGKRPWHAHREHLYQRLARGGWGHLGTALVYYTLMLACAASGLWALGQTAGVQHRTLSAWVLIYGILAAVTLWRYPLTNEALVSEAQ